MIQDVSSFKLMFGMPARLGKMQHALRFCNCVAAVRTSATTGRWKSRLQYTIDILVTRCSKGKTMAPDC